LRILGISAFYHDSAAALIEDGRIVAAAQEERFSRKKHDARFPAHAIRYCLTEGASGLGGVDHVVFYDKPFLKFERLVETYLTFAPRGFKSFRMAIPLWLREKLFLKDLLSKELTKLDGHNGWNEDLLFSEHHLSHAASAFFPSPYDEAVVLTMDGVGEWATTSAAIGRGNSLEVHKEIHFPHSLGFLYSAFTYYTGFKVNSGEYKVMGLAPYGEPKYAETIFKHLIDVKPDGSFRLDQSYFNYCAGLTMTNGKFHDLFGAPPRMPDQLLAQRHMDLAASVQMVLEETVLRMTRSLRAETGRVLAIWGDAGWGEMVREGKYSTDHFADELVEAMVRMIGDWKPKPSPQWVTCIPSLSRSGLVANFAERVARRLALPFRPCVRKLIVTAPQKEMQNSFQQARNLDGVFAIDESLLLPGAVLMIDDMVDSNWTLKSYPRPRRYA